MTDYMPRKCLSALPRMTEAERIVALEAQLLSVCQREAQTFARHDARIEALEAENARLQEIVAHYMRMFPTGEAALDALVEIEEETNGGANQAD